MTPDQRAEFERRIIQRAFEAGIQGCDLDTALGDIVYAMGLDVSDDANARAVSAALDTMSKPGGPLRSMNDADWLALSCEEWGRRIALLSTRPHTPHKRAKSADKIAKTLRGKAAT